MIHLDRTDYTGSCHRCECLRSRHYYRGDDLTACMNCPNCSAFQHHPGWAPLPEGQRVGLPDGQSASIAAYDASQDAYWVTLPPDAARCYIASHQLRQIA